MLVEVQHKCRQQGVQEKQVPSPTTAMRPVGCAELDDLIHLAGPLTEDAVLKCLQARFCASQLYVSINCWHTLGRPYTRIWLFLKRENITSLKTNIRLLIKIIWLKLFRFHKYNNFTIFGHLLK